MEPDGGLELVGDEAELPCDGAVGVGECSVRADVALGGKSVGAKHPGVQRDGFRVIGVPEVLPERPSLGCGFGVDGNGASGFGKDAPRFCEIPAEDAGWVVAGEEIRECVLCAPPLAAGAYDRKAGAQGFDGDAGLAREGDERLVFFGVPGPAVTAGRLVNGRKEGADVVREADARGAFGLQGASVSEM